MADKKKFTYDSYKLIKWVLLIAPFFMVLSIKTYLDNDTYWIIKTGEYIFNNGLPQKDFLTMHSNMDLVCQQWLSSVIFYKLYSWFGVAGPIALACIMFEVIVLLMHKLCKIVTTSSLAQAIVVLGTSIVLNRFIVTRPQIFTYAVVLVELICLEQFVRRGRWTYLIPLPILSVITVNLHASMWTMLFIIMMPYFANALPIKIKGKRIACCSIIPLIITAIVMVGAGLITPYGVKGMSFIFTSSIGNKVNSTISELTPINLSAGNAYYIGLIVIALGFYAYNLKKGSISAPLRYHLLILGTMAMGLKYTKLFPYFMLAGLTVATSLMSGYRVKFKKKFEDRQFNLVVGTEILFFTVMFIAAGIVADHITIIDDPSKVDQPTYIAQLDEMCDILDSENNDDIVLYNGFNAGGYLEFRGYKTYIDARADSFVVEANHDFDYLTEDAEIANGKLYYKEFIDKYGFTHFIVEKKITPYLSTSLKNDDDYKLVSENDTFELYEAVK